MTSKRYLVSIPEDLSEWLDKQRELTASGLFEKAVMEAMENAKIISEYKIRVLNQQET